MTFDEANAHEDYELLDLFEVEQNDSICSSCLNENYCRAKDVFHFYYPSDSISKCKFHEE